MHGGQALERQVVVHHGEHALLHLAAVPGVDDDLLTGGDVEGHTGLGVQAELLIVFDLRLGGVVDDKVRLEVLQLFLRRLDEHVGDEVGLPRDLDDEADGHTGVLVRAAECVDDEQALAAQLLQSDVLDRLPGLFGHGMVVVLIGVGRPPHGVLGVLVHDDVLVFGGTAGVDTGHNVHGTQLADLALFVAGELGLGLFREEHLVGRIVHDLGGAGDPILLQIDFSHFGLPLSLNCPAAGAAVKLLLHYVSRSFASIYYDFFRTKSILFYRFAKSS